MRTERDGWWTTRPAATKGQIEGFLDREQKGYAPSLDAYAAALGGASRGLYFPLHAAWREDVP